MFTRARLTRARLTRARLARPVPAGRCLLCAVRDRPCCARARASASHPATSPSGSRWTRSTASPRCMCVAEVIARAYLLSLSHSRMIPNSSPCTVKRSCFSLDSRVLCSSKSRTNQYRFSRSILIQISCVCRVKSLTDCSLDLLHTFLHVHIECHGMVRPRGEEAQAESEDSHERVGAPALLAELRECLKRLRRS